MLNREFLQRKIKLIQEDLGRLETFAPMTFDELAKDAVAYGAAERFLERIITRAIDINRHVIGELGEGNEAVRTYEDTFTAMSLLRVLPDDFAKQIAPSAGLRNVLVHEYDAIDQKLVYKSVHDALKQYTRYCGFILDFLDKTQQ